MTKAMFFCLCLTLAQAQEEEQEKVMKSCAFAFPIYASVYFTKKL